MSFMVRLNAEIDKLSVRAFVCVSFLGCGLCRACIGWMLMLVREARFLPDGVLLSGHHAVDLGELIGFVLAIILVRKRSPLYANPFSFIGSFACTVFGAMLMYVALVLQSAPIFYVGGFMGGFGYATLFLLWLEFYGCLSPRNMVLAYSCAYLANLFAWLALSGSNDLIGLLLVAVLAVCSASLVVVSYRKIPEGDRYPGKPSFRGLSWQLILWISIFAFAYGVGDSITGTGFATMASKIGMAVPGLVVIISILFMEKFDLGSVYQIALAFMLAGIGLSFFFASLPVLSQLLMSAANESYCMLAFVVACTYAYRTKTSSTIYCGILAASSLLFTQIGLFAGRLIVTPETSAAVSFAVVMMIVVASSFLFKERHLAEKVQLERADKSFEEEGLLRICEEKSFTVREKTIFLMLVRGKRTIDISDDLFISQSTVRSHVGKIYEKLQVHSRQEFDTLVGRQCR
ncbi:helix-turn-helix transcriptional regulator [Eggerthella timonensis]|uniref:helix-turn-helix transcriptional regulator n=1 Tax=Eggerthella timonensis TaxID=1871008 RepID=UPI000C75F42E|nr:helix-turn-helix transcriptional regulator [Eggerthella timonensis]